MKKEKKYFEKYFDIKVVNRRGEVMSCYRMIEGPLEITCGWICFKKDHTEYRIAELSPECGKIIIE